MVIGILGIKNENIQKANVIKTLKNICDLKSISIVEPISEYKSRIDELYSCNYPIFTNIKLDNANIKEVVQLFNLNKINNLIILPDFLGTNYWIKIVSGKINLPT